MKKLAIQKSLIPLERMPLNEWFDYIQKEVKRAETESIERYSKERKEKQVAKTVQRKREKQSGTRRVLLAAKRMLNN